MKRIASIIFAVVFVATACYLSSCRKKKEEALPNDGLTTESNEAQSQWDDVLKISEDAINGQGESSRTSANPTITKETISEGNFIGKITIDFGTNTVGNDGRTRSGQLIVKYTGKYRTTGTIIQSTTQNYFVNGKQIVGCRTVKNTNGTVFSVMDSALPDSTGFAQIIYPNGGGTTTWKSTRTRTWTAGSSTIGTLSDDVYSVSGSASGVSKEGKAYTMTITNLIVKLECFFTYYIYMPAGGTIDIVTTEGTRSVNYGNGVSCDRDVTFTAIDGKMYELSL
ncbi:MAG: lipoprotein precursor [Cytophagaceae bacterium]|jgi:hypothetical protein|nr:lipoprotein precursor [Cytophagaceae bacterium]